MPNWIVCATSSPARRAARVRPMLIPADTPAAVVVSGTFQDQEVVEGTLGTIAAAALEAKIGAPALLVVGEVVSLRSQIDWLQQTGEMERPQLRSNIGTLRLRAAERIGRARHAGGRS